MDQSFYHFFRSVVNNIRIRGHTDGDEILISVRMTPDSPEIIPMLKKSVKTFELELV